MDYQEFLKTKVFSIPRTNYQVNADDLNPLLFPFQRDIVAWALRKGRCAIWADTGLGKTMMQIEFAHRIGKRALIIAPLSVVKQTVREADKLGVEVHATRRGDDLVDGINITNYEMIEHFNPDDFETVVMDESSILKSLDGKTRKLLTEMFANTPHKLACTATPAPNDVTEIGRHAEFLGVMTNAEMLSAFFINDQKMKDGTYRLKGHAVDKFYEWLSSWALAIKRPSDIGYDDTAYKLPALHSHLVTVDSDYIPDGMLPGFNVTTASAIEARHIRRETIDVRISKTLEIVNHQEIQYNLGYQYTQEDSDDRRRKEGQKESVHGRMDSEESRQSESKQGQNTRAKKQKKARSIRRGQRSEGEDQGGIEGLCQETSRNEESAQAEIVWDYTGDIQPVIDGSESQLRNLRVFGDERQELLSASGSLPQNEQGSRASLYELQSGSRENERRSDPIGESNSLPEKEQWVIWCDLNDEQDRLAALLGDDCISVYGSMTPEQKAAGLEDFVNGKYRILISKVTIAGFGINMQNCHNTIFCGIGYSWEQYYQAIRRFWRFGQKREVNVFVVTSEQERSVYDIVIKKDIEASKMTDKLIEKSREYIRAELQGAELNSWAYREDVAEGSDWTMMLGDSVERINEIADNSVDCTVTSPPFRALYTYSPTERDLGNSRTSAEFFAHFAPIIDGTLRITKPGRNCCVHVQQVAATKGNDGFIGIHDFRGDVIRAYVAAGWIFHGEVTIDKNPQVQAIRTKTKGLMFQQLHKDSTANRPAFGDYMLIFQKPGENEVPVIPDVTNEEWIELAHPIWYDIRESDVLNVAVARTDRDERHLCPLQKGVIDNCIRLYTNRNELVFDPFGGIGSTPYEAVRLGRRGLAIELKPEYWKVACTNLHNAQRIAGQASLFDLLPTTDDINEGWYQYNSQGEPITADDIASLPESGD